MAAGKELPSPRAFITWAHRDADWDEDQAERWLAEVRAFAYVLRSLGVDAEIDLFRRSQRGIDWTRYGPKEIADREWVLVVLSRAWLERWEGRNAPTIGAGAAAEADALRGIFSKNQRTFRDKVVLIQLPSTADEDLVPLELHGVHRVSLTDFREGALEPLIRILTDQPEDPIPKLGKVPVLPPAADPVAGNVSWGDVAQRQLPREIDEEIERVKDALAHLPGPGPGEDPHLPWYRAWDQLRRRLAELEDQRDRLAGDTLRSSQSAQSTEAGARSPNHSGGSTPSANGDPRHAPSVGKGELVERLLRGLHDPDGGVRFSAMAALGNHLSPDLLPEIEPLLNDRDTDIRRYALEYYAELNPPDTRSRLVRGLHDPDSGVRFSAMAALGNHLSPDLLPEIEPLLDDRDTDIRRYALEYYAELR